MSRDITLDIPETPYLLDTLHNAFEHFVFITIGVSALMATGIYINLVIALL